MCKPVWFSVKRASMLSIVGRLPGAVVADPSFIAFKDKLTILDRIKDDNGILIIVSYNVAWGSPTNFKTTVAALWYPNFGGAGWVDLPKDPQTYALVKTWEQALEHKAVQDERDAVNCMAL